MVKAGVVGSNVDVREFYGGPTVCSVFNLPCIVLSYVPRTVSRRSLQIGAGCVVDSSGTVDVTTALAELQALARQERPSVQPSSNLVQAAIQQPRQSKPTTSPRRSESAGYFHRHRAHTRDSRAGTLPVHGIMAGIKTIIGLSFVRQTAAQTTAVACHCLSRLIFATLRSSR